MKKIEQLKEQHVIIFSFLVLISKTVLVQPITRLFKYWGIISGNTNTDYLISEIIVLAITIILLYICRQTHILKCGMKGFGKGLWSGAVFFVLAVFGCLLSVMSAAEQGYSYKAWHQIVVFILFVIAVGLAEEILFRGIIADSIYEHFGNSAFGVIISAILGGCFFGVAHVTNILAGQSVEATIIQMIAISMTGILLTAIYIRHKNVYAVAILHAVLDFFTVFEQGCLAGFSLQYADTDIDFWASLRQSLISQSTFVIVAVFVLRPSVLRKIVARKNPEKEI